MPLQQMIVVRLRDDCLAVVNAELRNDTSIPDNPTEAEKAIYKNFYKERVKNYWRTHYDEIERQMLIGYM